MNIVLIGSGNVASQLGMAFKAKACRIVQAYNPHPDSAEIVAKQLEASAISRTEDVDTQADLYIFAVKDTVLPELLKQFPATGGLWVHTAGSIPMSVFEGSRNERYGVLYPLQTFSRERNVSFDSIPFFIEAHDPEDEQLLEEWASKVSGRVAHLSSEKRQYLHLAAVFACNFTNHFYHIASQIIEKQGLNYDVLFPLIEETAAKIREIHPRKAQTGPAVRYDTNVMDKHLELLNDQPSLREIYSLISYDIHNTSRQVSK